MLVFSKTVATWIEQITSLVEMTIQVSLCKCQALNRKEQAVHVVAKEIVEEMYQSECKIKSGKSEVLELHLFILQPLSEKYCISEVLGCGRSLPCRTPTCFHLPLSQHLRTPPLNSLKLRSIQWAPLGITSARKLKRYTVYPYKCDYLFIYLFYEIDLFENSSACQRASLTDCIPK